MRRAFLSAALASAFLVFALTTSPSAQPAEADQHAHDHAGHNHAEHNPHEAQAVEHGGEQHPHNVHGEEPAGHGAAHGPAPINWANHGFRGKDAEGGTLEAGEEPMSPPFMWALINFSVFVILIVKFGGPKIRAALLSKHNLIAKELAEASRLRQEAATKLADYEKRISNVGAEMETLIREIRQDAEAEKARVLAEAESQAKALAKEAEERISNEIATAKALLEREVVNAAIRAAEAALRKNVEPADQRKLFDQFLGSLSHKGNTPGPVTDTPSTKTDKGWV